MVAATGRLIRDASQISFSEPFDFLGANGTLLTPSLLLLLDIRFQLAELFLLLHNMLTQLCRVVQLRIVIGYHLRITQAIGGRNLGQFKGGLNKLFGGNRWSGNVCRPSAIMGLR